MKLKKTLSIVLVIVAMCSLFGGFTALADEAVLADGLVSGELLIGGNMELIGTSFSMWKGHGELSIGFAHSGERSSKQVFNEEIIVHQRTDGIISGEEYTLSAYLYVKEVKETPIIKKDEEGNEIIEMPEIACFRVLFLDETGKELSAVSKVFAGTVGQWEQIFMNCVAPAGATEVSVQLSVVAAGEIFWDDASFVGKTTAAKLAEKKATDEAAIAAYERSNLLLAEEQAKDAAMTVAPDAAKVIVNSSFEEAGETEDCAKGWEGFQKKWGEVTFRSNEEAHTGNYSMKILGTPDTYMPWARQTVSSNFIVGNTYVFSAWVKAKELQYGNSVFLKTEYYNSNEINASSYMGGAESSNYKLTDDEWTRINMVFTMPENTATMQIYIRTSTGNAVVYYDDVELGPTADSSVMNFMTEYTFNYTEVENAKTSTTIDYISSPIEAGSTVEYTIKDGDTVVYQESVPAAPSIKWSFPVMKLAETGKAYTIEAAYKKADGSVIETTEPRRIYRYNRPTMLDEQGRFIDENGKPIDVVFLYGAFSKFFDDYAAAGITVVRPDDIRSDETDNIAEYRKLMDAAHEKGLKVIYQLYGNAAGHPMQISTTKRFVEAFKDHPALLAWMLCDEPSYQYLPGRQAQTYKEILEYVEMGYKVVRDLDPHHPIYVLEGISPNPTAFEETFQLADIVAMDPYPKEETETTYTYQIVKDAVGAAQGVKEVWSLGYAHNWYYPSYIPDADGLRMQNYMALWAGASGFGYYTYPDFTPTLMEVLKQSNESGERHQMFDHFVRGNSPVFDEYMGPEYWYRSWVDKDKMYLVVKEHKNDGENTNLDFKLKSTNGLIEINGYTAKLVSGTTEETFVSDNSTFKLTMKPTQISLYEIIPNAPVDFSKITNPVYNDLVGFEWAQDAIVNTTKNKIANSKGANLYAPGENITRGDFAMYLIRTLGLTADVTDQFADVDPNSEYAKEIAIGKALGILKGTGGNSFEPEQAISRQDLMVICARGLRIAKGLADADYQVALANFTDKGLIADYAINDIGAMVSARIITGNPDLTINPLGNTTRAEAAVIMDRIYR